MGVFNKFTIPVAAVGLAFATAAGAVVVPGTFNTGAGLAAGDGQVDSNYVVFTSNTFAPGTQARTYYNSAYLPDDSAARWVNATGDGNGVAGATTAFRTTFSLAGYDISSATLSGQVGFDDFGTVLLNGVLINSTSGFGTLNAFGASSGFVAGLNTLDFVLNNNGGPEAFIVAGLTVTANASATPAVPEPATWAMMLAGFGLVGYSLRRRSVRFASLAA